MKAACYVRVSSEEQANEGCSIEAQKEKLKAYCTLRGLELVEVIIDAGVSGGKPLADREGGKRILAAKVDAIVAVKLDRLFRDAADALTVTKAWDKKGVALHLLDLGGNSLDTSSAMGRMFLTMCAGFAELERGLIRERTKTAMDHLRAKGKRIGAIPFGFDLKADGETLTPNAGEQKVVAMLRTLRAKGYSLRKIASELQSRGIKTKTGAKWSAEVIRGILNRKAAA